MKMKKIYLKRSDVTTVTTKLYQRKGHKPFIGPITSSAYKPRVNAKLIWVPIMLAAMAAIVFYVIERMV